MEKETRTQRVYDSPTRVFHWIFAALFVFAYLVAKTVDSESPRFSYHMLAGLMLGFVVLLRLVWGVIGTKYARFSSFALRPTDLFSYTIGIFKWDKRRWVGHNPASSWASLVMFALALGLAGTGYLMATGAKETFEDVHEVMANVFLVVVLAHVAGVALHGLKHKDGIAFSMTDGKKVSDSSAQPVVGNKTGVAFLFLILISTFGAYLFKNYDRQGQTLTFFGSTLSLSEGEENETEGHDEFRKNDGDRKSDDDDD